jgi:hypothetical protein
MQINHKFDVLRLCRLMCGKALPFRFAHNFFAEAMPQEVRERRSLRISNAKTERLSLSAHRAAPPRSFIPGSCILTEAIKRV